MQKKIGSLNVINLNSIILIHVNDFIHFADGDIGTFDSALTAYMKQKHRLIWERRHGPVGSGMRPRSEWGTPYEPPQENN